jgi:NADH:ubiquinone oxidoreductase subunit 3 (subunit A)
MFEFGILFIFNSIFVLILLLWLVTLIGSLFFDSKDTFEKTEFYECGFLKISDLRFSLSINTIHIIIFILLYDIELLFTIPLVFFLDSFSFFLTINSILLLFSIIITIYMDIVEDILNLSI